MDEKSAGEPPVADVRPRRTLFTADRGVHLSEDQHGQYVPDPDDLAALAASGAAHPAITGAAR